MSDSVCLVVSSVPSPEVGIRLVETLVEERHAACGSVLPGAVSVYWWQGTLERAHEAVVMFKTTRPAAPDLLERLAEIHPYDVPEILVLPVELGHPAYLDWIRAEVAGD